MNLFDIFFITQLDFSTVFTIDLKQILYICGIASLKVDAKGLLDWTMNTSVHGNFEFF